MMEVGENGKAAYEVKNVKLHFKSPIKGKQNVEKQMEEEQTSYRTFDNFITFRLDGFTFTFFLKSGHVNVSGIPSFESIGKPIACFNRVFKTNIDLSECKVDNTTASGKLPENLFPLYLHRLVEHGKKHGFLVTIRPHYFPSALIRPLPEEKTRLATAILFTNGKFIIVGAATREKIDTTWRRLTALIRTAS